MLNAYILNRENRDFIILWILANIADFTLTIGGLHNGLVESNPILTSYPTVKLALAALVCAAAPKLSINVKMILFGAMIAVIAMNLYLLLGRL
jgi:hypothetical protein